jgi:protein-S-isoprenylcysteine O-methyltransferase Ste14
VEITSAGLRVASFAVATALLGFMSRASLRNPRSHGFHRFYVFEVLMALILINGPVWFVDPFSWHQIVSWLLLCLSLALVILGAWALRVHGRSNAEARPEPELLTFERTSRLVQRGIYSRIRHPMYGSLLALAWGVFFKAPSFVGAVLAGVASLGVALMTRIEEAECIKVFGRQYRDYMRRTWRLVPGLY